MRVNWQEQCAEMQVLLEGKQEEVDNLKDRASKCEQYKAENDQLKGEIRQLIADKSNLKHAASQWETAYESSRVKLSNAQGAEEALRRIILDLMRKIREDGE